MAAGAAACAIGVVACVLAICVWHFAHSALPTNLEREAADLVGHHPGDSTWSSVDIETLDRVEEAECVDAGELAARCAQKNAAANREAAMGTRARGLTSDT